LELARMRKLRLEQRRSFGEIYVNKVEMTSELLKYEQEKLDNMA
jgi:chromatin segregation and condensation protein Rec8/ScpA/Scc1 (kleisin family)